MAGHSHLIQFYGLSTCIHCKHAREFLEANQQPCDIVYVDLLEGEDRAKALSVVKEYNPNISFPTIIIDHGASVVIGFQPEKLSQVLGI